MKFWVWHNGDRSVGINSDQATVEIDVYKPESKDGQEYIRTIKEILQPAFTELWEFKAHVMTDKEMEEKEGPID